MDRVKERVLAEIEKAWPEQLAHLQAIVREASTLGNESGIQRRMQGTFRQMGLEVDVFELDPGALQLLPAFSPTEWSYRGRPNVVGRWRATESGGRSLVLNGHIDVVSPEPISDWTYDPWSAEIIGDRMYGRGACDMKSGVNAMVWAVRAIQSAGVRLRGDVLLESVIEEECTGNGTLACLARGYVGDACLIPEPIFGQALVAQVGVLWCRVRIRGMAGHVFEAEKAVNAIEKMYLLIQAMRQLESDLNQQRHPAYSAVPSPIHFNPGTIRAGDWPSTVPAECELTFRMGFYPGMSAEDAKSMVCEQLLAAARRDPWLQERPPEITFYGFRAEGTVLDHTASPLLGTLKAAYEEVTGRSLGLHAGTGTTDSRYFLLDYGIPATCIGASGGCQHGVDEYVDLPTVLETTKVIAAFILDWCQVAKA